MSTGSLGHDRFDERYPELFARLTRLARALGAGEDAEDIAQEALIEGRRQLPRLRDPEKLEPWLRRMTVRAAWRARVGRQSPASTAIEAYVPVDMDGAIDIGQAVARLPPRERIAVTLVYGLGLSQPEAAAAMGITRGGIAAALFKARARLVRSLRE